MDRIAFIVGGTFIYWNSIVLTLAAGVAILPAICPGGTRMPPLWRCLWRWCWG